MLSHIDALSFCVWIRQGNRRGALSAPQAAEKWNAFWN